MEWRNPTSCRDLWKVSFGRWMSWKSVLFWLPVTRMSKNEIALSCSNSMVNFTLLWHSTVLTCYIPKNLNQVNKIRITTPGSFESPPSRAACQLLCKDRSKKQNWISGIQVFYDNCEIHARSLVNFYCQYADRHMNLKFMRRVSEREPAIRQFVIVKSKLMSVVNASVLLLIMNFVITLSK